MKLLAYRNLHNGLISLKDPKQGVVVAHTEVAVFKNAEFRVGEKGRQRVIQTKQKNVHAFVSGELVAGTGAKFFKNRETPEMVDAFYSSASLLKELDCIDEFEVISYNPYRFGSFYRKSDSMPVTRASLVIVKSDGSILAKGIS